MGLATRSVSRRWRNGVIPFIIHSSIRNVPASLTAVQGAINHWNANTCLQFIPRTSQTDFVEFREHATACRSAVGRQGGRQTVLCDLDTGAFRRGNVIHEIGHAIGLIHEHSRRDRDLFVVVSAGVLNNGNYRIRDELRVGLYDCNSIMHYPPITGRIQPRPGLCGGMGQRNGLSPGDTATVRFIYRFLRRGDSGNAAGEAREIALINHRTQQLVTAVRTQNGRLKLISWRVTPSGSVRRTGDSGNQAGTASHIDIARGLRYVVACRTGAGDLKLISWDVSAGGAISRRGDSGSQAGTATHIRIVALTNTLFVTACRTAAGRLKLITWRLNADGSLTRLRDSGNAAGAVSEVSMVQVPRTGSGSRVVTSVRTGGGRLKLIVWNISATGVVSRAGDSGNAAGGATLIRSAVDGLGQVVTACRTSEGILRVINWRISASGGQVTRLGDSANQAGRIGDNSLVIHGGNMAISGVRTAEGRLRLIGWNLGPNGAIARMGDSADQAGTASRISLNGNPLAGNARVVSAVRTANGRLKLISWARC